LLPTKKRLQRGNRHWTGITDLAQRLRIVDVQLNPVHVERLQRLADADEPLRLEVEIQVKLQERVWADALAPRALCLHDVINERLCDGPRRVVTCTRRFESNQQSVRSSVNTEGKARKGVSCDCNGNMRFSQSH
jgi:hypothetical protein